MDVLANKVALKSGVKKGKLPFQAGKKKVKKNVSSVQSPKFSPKVLKNEKVPKADKKKKNETIKEVKPLVKKRQSDEVGPISQKSKKTKKEDSCENQKSIKVKTIPQKLKKVKKEDSSETQKSDKLRKISQKSKKIKKAKLIENQKNIKTEKVSQKTKKVKTEDSSDENKPLNDSPDFQLSSKQIEKGVSALLKLANDETDSSKSLMADEKAPIFLQVCNIKIPKTPSRQLRMSLPHSLVAPDDDVALIVKDLKKGRRTSYEPTVEHFEQLLQEHKCRQIKTIIPINQIKTEYDQFELKRNLLNSYDYFLIDGRISGHVARLLGRVFSKKRKLPTSIKMGSKDLKHEIDYALNKTSMQLNANGDSHIVQIGTTTMPESHIVENIEAASKNLAKNYPGGWSNIRALRIKTQNSLAIPIYMTMKNKNEVKTPNVKPKRPKAFKTHEDELTTAPGDATVIVRPDGVVKLKKKMSKVSSKDQQS